MEKSRRIVSEICSVVAFAATVCMVIMQDHTSVAADVEKNFAQMDELNVEQALSSNPYDYIDNEYYDSIVELGFPAVAVLEENYHNGTYSGVNGYIAALAIQDITGLNLYECTGIDWSTAEEFFDQWDTTMQNLPDTFGNIMESDAAISDKMHQIEKYGVFGRIFLEKAKEARNGVVKFDGAEVTVDEALDGEDVLDVSKQDVKEVAEYLDGVIE